MKMVIDQKVIEATEHYAIKLIEALIWGASIGNKDCERVLNNLANRIAIHHEGGCV